MHQKTKRIVMAALLAALTCVATMIVKIPSPMKGYINLGDCIVLVSGWMLPPGWGFLAAGVGSAMADLLSGYVIYGPATFLIKGLMALAAFYGFQLLHKKWGELASRLVSAIAAEAVMIVGYFLFAGFLYGFGAAVVNIPANGVQAVTGILISVILIRFLEQSKINLK